MHILFDVCKQVPTLRRGFLWKSATNPLIVTVVTTNGKFHYWQRHMELWISLYEHVTCMLQAITCRLPVTCIYIILCLNFITQKIHKLYNTQHLDLCVTSDHHHMYHMHICKIPLSHHCTWSVHLIYITSTYLYPIPPYTLNHTAYPHTSHISHPHSSGLYIFKQQHKV